MSEYRGRSWSLGIEVRVTELLAPNEWRRPWKLFSFTLGLGWLLWGALTFDISDWDVGVSLLMAGFTYLLAPAAARVLMRRDWRQLPFAVLAWWWSVDRVYMAWHPAVGNVIYRERTSTRRPACFGSAVSSGCRGHPCVSSSRDRDPCRSEASCQSRRLAAEGGQAGQHCRGRLPSTWTTRGQSEI